MLVFRPCPADEAPASTLLAAMVAEMAEVYGDIDEPGGSPLDPTEAVYLVGYDEADEPVAGGALKRLGYGVVEIKRMYVAPEHRRKGYARQLLRALEGLARDLGYRTARLDTGPEQPHAEAMYVAAGYRPIADYNRNRHASFWGEKRLPE